VREITLGELAERLGGALEGDPDVVVRGVAALDAAGVDQVSFLADPKYLSLMESTSAAGVIVSRNISCAVPNLIRVDNPYLGFAAAMEVFYAEPHEAAGISDRSFVHEGARIGKEPSIHPFAVVCQGARIGDRVTLMSGAYVGPDVAIGHGTVIHPNVVLEHDVSVGTNVVIHAGTVVGSDGFGFATEKGLHKKIVHKGTVRIEDDVEIGAGCTIDRAVFGETVIGRGTKLDNLVHLAHNVVTGRNCLLAGQAGLAGSTVLGDNVIIAGQSGVSGHLNIGNGTIVMARTGVTRDTLPGARLAGFPAIDAVLWKRASAVFNKLDELRKRVINLEKELLKIHKGSSQEEER